MTEMQKKFAAEYLKDCNATQAAIRAGYSQKTAYSIGQRLLKNVEIRNAIDTNLESIQSSAIADAEEVMKYLTGVMRGESIGIEIVVEGAGDGYSTARTMEKPPSEKDRLKAAELIGKRYGMFTDKMNMEVTSPVVISGGDKLED